MSKQFEAVTIPKWGIEMTHGRIVEWRCAEGATVAAGDELVDIETDKIVNSFEARESGTLVRILVPEGEELPVGTLIGVIAVADYSPSDLDQFISAQTTTSTSLQGSTGVDDPSDSGDGAAAQSTSSTNVKISPALLRKLSKAGISPELVTGSGPDGRILKEDVDRAIEQGSLGDASPVERHALNASQKKVASALSEAQSTVPIYHVRRQLRVGRALAQMKEQLPNGSGLLTALLVNAVARALARHPTLNTQFETDALKPVGALNVAVAVARDDGAVAAPVLINIDQLSIAEIAEGLSSLVTRARAGRLVAGDVQPAAIAISNLGMYGVDDFTAMVTPPQVMVLSVGRLSVQPSWDAQTQTFVPEEQVTVTLGSDHRVVNGAQAAEFLQSLAALIEDTD